MTLCPITKRDGSIPRRPPRRGAMLILIAVMLFMFLMTVAFSIDIAQMHLSRAELRAATDAAAKAAATTLADTTRRDFAVTRGQEIAAANLVNNASLLLDNSDFAFGNSRRVPNGKFQFSPEVTPSNSVKVRGRRTSGSRSGAVPLFFGNVTGTRFFEPQVDATATYIERDITLVVDRSGSMAGQNFRELSSAIELFLSLLEETPSREDVGLASYSNTATQDVQLSRTYSGIRAAMRSMRTEGATSISAGMRSGQQIASRGRPIELVQRTMIVMTDGIHNTGAQPRTVAVDLAAQNVIIHTITFGPQTDRPRMIEVAEIGGGRHFHAQDGRQLREVYREIALTLGTIITE